MNVLIRDIAPNDLPLIERWLHREHVRSAWGDPEPIIELLREPPADGNWRAVIETDGRAVGVVLWQHPTREELDGVGLTDVPTSVIDIDIMIGESDALGRGSGSTAVDIVATAALRDGTVPFVMACARLDNVASQRAFAKAGFEKEREFIDVPGDGYALMVRRRA